MRFAECVGCKYVTKYGMNFKCKAGPEPVYIHHVDEEHCQKLKDEKEVTTDEEVD